MARVLINIWAKLIFFNEIFFDQNKLKLVLILFTDAEKNLWYINTFEFALVKNGPQINPFSML